MDQNWMKRQRELTDRLNRYRNEYYNLNSPSVSDAAYDRLFEELQAVENKRASRWQTRPPAPWAIRRSASWKNESPDSTAVPRQSEEYRGIVPLYGRASGDVHAQVGRPYHQTDL